MLHRSSIAGPGSRGTPQRTRSRWAAPTFAIVVAVVASAPAARATSSSTLWTNTSPDIQAFGVVHLGLDNYFTVGRTADEGAGDFPTDLGLTVGILPFEKFQMEVGVDVFEPSDHPWVLNFKLGAPEGALFTGSPALYAGMFGLGTEKGVTDFNVAYLTIGKTLGRFGRISAGPYAGNDELLRSATGKKEDTGFMVAWDHGFHPVTDAGGNTFNRWVLAADYASGDNAVGGCAAGFYVYFNKDIDVAVAPVWFNDEGVNGKWKLTVQLDANLPSRAL